MKTYQLFDGEKYLSQGKKWSTRTRKIRIAQHMLLVLYSQADYYIYEHKKDMYRIVHGIKDRNTRLRTMVSYLPQDWTIIADSGERYTPLEFFDAYKRGDLK